MEMYSLKLQINTTVDQIKANLLHLKADLLSLSPTYIQSSSKWPWDCMIYIGAENLGTQKTLYLSTQNYP